MNSLRKRETDAPSPFYAPDGHAVLNLEIAFGRSQSHSIRIWQHVVVPSSRRRPLGLQPLEPSQFERDASTITANAQNRPLC